MSIIEKLSQIRARFGEDYDRAMHFEILTLNSQLLSYSLALLIDPDANAELRARLLHEYPDVENYMKDFFDRYDVLGGRQAYHDLIIEKAFIDRFNVFEFFLKDIFSAIALEYPTIFFQRKDSVKVYWSDIFTESEYGNIRESIIRNEIKEIMISKSLDKFITHMFSLFEMETKSIEEHLRQIFLVSRLRNMIVHNSGKVAQPDLKLLNREFSPWIFQANESIMPFLNKRKEDFQKLLGDTALEIYALISADLPRIESMNLSKS